MNRNLVWLTRVYALLIGLYPFEFRTAFGNEMQTVFRSALVEQAGLGASAAWKTFWREVRDWPAAVVAEYFSAIKNLFERGIMAILMEDKSWKIEERREAIIASLPPLLFGLGIALAALVTWKPWYALSTWQLWMGVAFGLLPAVIIALVAIWALIKRIPIWGYTWLGAAAMGLVLLVKTAAEEREDFGLPFLSPFLSIVIAILILVGLAVLLGIAAWRGWRQSGMVSLGFTTMVGMSIVSMAGIAPFNRYDLTLLAAPLGLILSLLIYAYVKLGDGARILAFAGFGGSTILTLILVSSVWQSWLTESSKPSPFVPFMVVVLMALFVGPIAGVIGQPIRRLLRGA